MPWRAGSPSTSPVRMLNFAPWHGHVTCDRAYRQRPTFMGAGVLEGVEVAVNIEQGEPLAADFDPSCLTGREFVCFGDFQKLSHRLILQISGPDAAYDARHKRGAARQLPSTTPLPSGGVRRAYAHDLFPLMQRACIGNGT